MSKKITPENLDKWLFNQEEGNLSPAEQRELDDFLNSYPELQEEAGAWKAAHLSGPLSPYVFESELHALATTNYWSYSRLAAAAGLLFLLGGSAWYLFFTNEEFNFNINLPKEAKVLPSEGSDENSINNQLSDNAYDLTHTNSDINNSVSDSNLSADNNSVVNNSFNGLNNFVAANGNSSQNNANDNNSDINIKKRDQVSIDIEGEVKIKDEKEYLYVDGSTEEEITPQENSKTLEEEIQAILPLIENKNNVVISSAKNGNDTPKRNNGKKRKYKLDPNPTFTNLRDHSLLATNNNLIDHYGGFSGGMLAPRFTLNYRNNWTGNVGLNSQTAVFSYDQMMRKLKTGIGFSAKYDTYNKGTISNVSAALTLSPKFKLGKGITLEPFVTASYSQKNIKSGDQLTGSYIEPNRGNVAQLYQNGIVPEQKTAYAPDVKIGAVFQHKKFWAATSINQLMMTKQVLYSSQPNQYRDQVEVKATVGTDYIHTPETGIIYSPQFSVYHHNGMQEYWLGMTTKFRQLVVGASVSQRKELIATTGIEMHSFKLLYQFDMTKSVLMDKILPSHELSLRFALKGNNRSQKPIFDFK